MTVKQIRDKYNKDIQNGKSFSEAYQNMMLEKNARDFEFYQKHGFHLNEDYAYLYPSIFKDNV